MVAVWCLAQGQLYSVMAHMYIALVGYPQECYGQQKICLISKSENLPPNNFRNYQSRSVILLKQSMPHQELLKIISNTCRCVLGIMHLQCCLQANLQKSIVRVNCYNVSTYTFYFCLTCSAQRYQKYNYKENIPPLVMEVTHHVSHSLR